MDFGAYAVSSLRGVLRSEPTKVTSASYRPMPAGSDTQVDEAIYATYEFANGATGKISADLRAQGGYAWFPSLTKNWPSLKNLAPTIRVKCKARAEEEEVEENGTTLIKTTQKEFVFLNYIGPFLWHRIDIITTTTFSSPTALTSDGKRKIIKIETNKESRKVYEWERDASTGKRKNPGEAWWSTYRFQLEEFVNRVKGRKGSGVWVSGEDSIRQMEAIDKTYLEAELPLRPTWEGLEEEGTRTSK